MISGHIIQALLPRTLMAVGLQVAEQPGSRPQEPNTAGNIIQEIMGMSDKFPPGTVRWNHWGRDGH